MDIICRADFDFKAKEKGIRHCTGYVLCSDVALEDNGNYTFKAEKVIVHKYNGKAPNFKEIEELAIQNCRLFKTDEMIIDVESLSAYHD